MILNFHDYINEKMSTLTRFNQETDEFRVSEIVNNFINEILKNPNDTYKKTRIILDRAVEINYIPNTSTHIKGSSSNGDTVNIYQRIDKSNQMDIKYLIIHELIHIIQQITSSVDERHLSFGEKIRRDLIQPTIDQLEYRGESTYFMYMLYRENMREIYAWSHDAYELAFSYKKKNPNKSNRDVVDYVLDEVQMSHKFLNIVVDYVKNDDCVFMSVVSILVGHFSEFGGIPKQLYFDKSIFDLEIIKMLKKETRDIVYNNNDIDDVENRLFQMINFHMSDLLSIKDEITSSFIEHLKYWHKRALEKWGKAIQLGIDDAEID